jgi:prepilin-type N-terminal cleavage/methylation domain-containing protein
MTEMASGEHFATDIGDVLPSSSRRDDLPPEDGFTLIELLVAMLVFAIIASAAAYGLYSAFNATAGNRQRIVASSLVGQALDGVEATPFTSASKLNSTSTTTMNAGVVYTTSYQVQDVSPPPNSGDTCSFNAAGTNGAFLVVNVTVSWTDMRGLAPASGQVEISPPANVISNGYATETVQITGASGLPVSGTSVSINGSNPQTGTTDSNGCASFTDLLPGTTYTVTSASGLIDQSQADQGTSPPVATWSTPSALLPNSANYAPLTWDRPAFVSTAVSVPTGYTAPNQTLPLNLQALEQTGGNSYDTLDNITSAVDVFPFSAGWRTWAGSCTGSDPGAAASGTITTAPGSAETGQAPLFEANITTKSALVSGATITATYVPPSGGDTGCPSGQTLTYNLAAPASPGSTGPFLLALPWGTWTFTSPQLSGQSLTLTMTGSGVAGTL